MDRKQAKFILEAYRSGGQDARDDAFAEALNMVRKDPELGAWFSRSQGFDRALSGKLREIHAPAGLRESILAGARFDSQRQIWWRRPQVLALAAGLTLLVSFIPFLINRAPADPGSELAYAADLFDPTNFAVSYYTNGFKLDHHSADVGELTGWLADRSTPLPTKIQVPSTQLSGLGCRKIAVDGGEIGLLCFIHEGEAYHLFILRRDDFPQVAGWNAPRFEANQDIGTISWSEPEAHFVMITDGNPEHLRKFL